MLRLFKIALVALIGLSLAAVLVTARSSLMPAGHTGDSSEPALEIPEERELPVGSDVTVEPPVQALPGAVFGSDARNVGGGMISAPNTFEGPLERIEPRPQPTPPAAPKLQESNKSGQSMRWRLIYNSVISAAGVFDQNGTALVLPGIDIIPVNEACTAPNGMQWPCGMVARTAFRNYVKGRAITCRVPDSPSQDSFAAECLLAGQDMAAWLVEQGWARAKPDALYADLEMIAKDQQRGVHGNPPHVAERVGGVEPVPAIPAGPAANP